MDEVYWDIGVEGLFNYWLVLDDESEVGVVLCNVTSDVAARSPDLNVDES